MVVFGPFLLLLSYTSTYLCKGQRCQHLNMPKCKFHWASKQTPQQTSNEKAIGHMGTLIKSRSTPLIIGFSYMYIYVTYMFGTYQSQKFENWFNTSWYYIHVYLCMYSISYIQYKQGQLSSYFMRKSPLKGSWTRFPATPTIIKILFMAALCHS